MRTLGGSSASEFIPAASEQMSSSAPSRMRWVLVFWVAAMGAISYLDRVNLSIAGPSIAEEFHLDNILWCAKTSSGSCRNPLKPILVM
jgi:hypothetical protein